MSGLGADLDYPLPAPTTTRARPRVARSRTRNGSVAGSRSASNSAVASGSSSRQSSTLGSRTEPFDLDLEYPVGDETASSEEPLAGPSSGGFGIGGDVVGVGKRELEGDGEEDMEDGRRHKRRRVELVDEEDNISVGAGPSSSYSTHPPPTDRFGGMLADSTFTAGSSLSSDLLYNSDIYEEMLSEVIHDDSFQTREPEVLFDDMDRLVPPTLSSSNPLPGSSSSALSSQALPPHIMSVPSSSSEVPQAGPSTIQQLLSPPRSPATALPTLHPEPTPVAGPSSMTASAVPPASLDSRRPSTPSTPGSPLSPPPKSPTPKKPTPQPSPQPQDPAAEYLHTYSCPICFGQPTNATVTPCGHILCGECLFTAVTAASMRTGVGGLAARCPVCRAPLPGWDGRGGGVIGLKPRTLISL